MAPQPSPSRTIDLPALSIRAAVTPSSVDAENRTVEVVFSTGSAVKRYDWRTGTYFLEKLSMEPAHVRLDRLNAGGPVLDTHSGWGLDSVLGVVEDGTAKMSGKKGTARLRFSKDPSVDSAWRKVEERVVRNVSVGYVVHAYEERAGKTADALPTRTAIDWEPYEISFVPMPADPGAQTRDGKPTVETHPCLITVRASEESSMDPITETSETVAERNPLDPGAPITRADPAPPAEPSDAQLAATAERGRVQGIMAACRASRMTQDFQDGLIRDGIALVDAQTRIFDEMRRRGGESAGPSATAVRVTGEDPMVHVRAGIENALAHRLAGDFRKRDGTLHFPLTDLGRKYRGMTLLDVGRAYMQGRGIRVTDMSKYELAGVSLGLTDVRGGMHSSSDFANLLADVANKTLRAAYEEQPQTFRPIVRVVTMVDFKPVNRVQLGDAPALLEIGEDGEYKSGTISDGKITYQLASYGRKFAITRKALINDDTDAFARVPMMFGRKARVLESNLVWAQITGNPTMPDGFALFSAQHGNLGDGDLISVESLGRGRSALRKQTSLDGDYLNLNAVFLIVPTTLETKADQFVTVVLPQAAGTVNPFQSKLQVIAEPRLDAVSETAWHLAASPTNVDIVELGYLEGDEGPRVESRVGFDVDGLEIKAGIDVVAKVVDHRGLYKDPGELDS